MIEIECLGCGKVIRCEDKYAGKKASCKECGKELLLPGGSPKSTSHNSPKDDILIKSMKVDFELAEEKRKKQMIIGGCLILVLIITSGFIGAKVGDDSEELKVLNSKMLSLQSALSKETSRLKEVEKEQIFFASKKDFDKFSTTMEEHVETIKEAHRKTIGDLNKIAIMGIAKNEKAIESLRNTIRNVGDTKTSSGKPDPQKLKLSSIYMISAQTPLMSEMEPKDPIAAAKLTIILPKDSLFMVHLIGAKNGDPWYYVSASDPTAKKQIGVGWINSSSLTGQDLRKVK